MSELTSRISNSKPDDKPHLVFICETHFNGDKSVSNLAGYQCFRKDRSDGRSGGGVCIYIANCIKATTDELPRELMASDVEQIWCVVHLGSEKILVGCIYRPTNSSLQDHLQHTKRVIEVLKYAQLVEKSLGCSSIHVYGDFNLPHARYEALDVDGGTATLAYICGRQWLQEVGRAIHQ